MHKWLGGWCLAVCLTGCTGLPWGAAPRAVDAEAVLFSHGQAVLPVELSPNAWSPTAWLHGSAPAPVEPERKAVPQPVVAGEPELTVYFANDADTLAAGEQARLRRFANDLKLSPTATLDVTGHTDSNHTPAYNVDLSRRRAETVKTWLVQWGVPEAQINTAWQGLRLPAATNADDEGRARNRRVEIRLRPA